MSAFVQALRSIASTVVFVGGFAPLWLEGRLSRRRGSPWVIGGHRGRIYEDNAGALHRFVRAHTDQPIVWIANRGPTFDRLRAEGHAVLERNSLAARRQILKAPVLIYSHGEDDLDLLMMFLRPFVGFRVFLMHSMSVIKGGQAYSPHYERAGSLRRWFARFVMTDFDALLATSEREARNLRRSFPHRTARIHGGCGGAHLDDFMRLAGTPAEKRIYYFPTHRDEPVGRKRLEDFLDALVARRDLREWLESNGYRFRIGAHINTGTHRLSVSGPFELAPLSELKEDMSKAALFVSDYSGLLGNFLAFDRPIIHVPFDWESYRKHRYLYESLEDFASGPICWDLDELVRVLTTGEWANEAIYGPRRALWRARIFPRLRPEYAEACYRAIVELSEGRDASAAMQPTPGRDMGGEPQS